VQATTDLEEPGTADLLVVVVPSQSLGAVLEGAGQLLDLAPGAPILSCVKGINCEDGRRPSEIIAEAFPGHPIAVLSGPNHAEEVARQMATAAVIGCENAEAAGRLQDLLNGSWFRAYTSTDLLGIEYGGAAKNVFAIAGGIADGLGLGGRTSIHCVKPLTPPPNTVAEERHRDIPFTTK
jgi:glycerol-3-phosphate dehydrogenase (NAD(P)+)